MKVGSLVYATEQGLGRLAKAFYDHDIFQYPLIVKHPRHETHPDWYRPIPMPPALARTIPVRGEDFPPKDHAPVADIHNIRQIRGYGQALIDMVDVMLFFETPFDWSLIEYARRAGVATVLMTMYECTPARIPVYPDYFLCPSLLDLEYFGGWRRHLSPFPQAGYVSSAPTGEGWKSVYLPVPVDVPWRQRERVRTFVHNAGHGSFRDRNGTEKVLKALWLADCFKGTSDARFIFRSQFAPSADTPGPRGDLAGKIEWRVNRTEPYSSLWNEGDVFLFPESFNGLSLPLQEARAAGMLVMGTDRFPMNTWLPRGPLIPTAGTRNASIGGSYNVFQEAIIDPEEIARKMDAWYGRDIYDYSAQGEAWAKKMSWNVLDPLYKKTLEAMEGGQI